MKIAIVGLGGSYSDYIAARVASHEFDEVWGINCIGGIIHVDKTFMMDPVSRFLDTENAGSQTGIAREFLKTNKKPIITNRICCYGFFVLKAGIEPAQPKLLDFESSASTSSAT